VIDLEFIERLIKAFDDSSVDSLEIERGGTRVRLAKTPPSAQGPVPLESNTASTAQAHAADATAREQPSEPTAEPPPSNLLDITSPMVGTFLRAPAPDAPPYVEPGTRVSPGDTLCIIEAMKLMNELECEITGTVSEICVENAQPVEFGQVLFRVEPG